MTNELLEAFDLISVASRREISAKATVSTGAAKAVLRAVSAQYDGDVDRAISILWTQFSKLSNTDRAVVADVLAPIMVMRHDWDAVERLAREQINSGWFAPGYALLATAAAQTGKFDVARRLSRRALQALEADSTDSMRFRVLQRLARAAFFVSDFDAAIDLAYSSAAISSSIGAWRAAASGYAIAYNIHSAVTGDLQEADRLARLSADCARKSGDASFELQFIIAEYEIAVHYGDDDRISALDRDIRIRLLPQQYTERFPHLFSQALARGFSDLRAMRTLLQVLSTTSSRSRGQLSLCSSLIAVAFAAECDDEAARLAIRKAISHLGRPSLTESAYERRYRRLSRASIAVACVLIHDEIRANRIVAVAESRDDHGEHLALDLVRSANWSGFPKSLSGLSRVYRLATVTRARLAPPAGLTQSEMSILQLLANGQSAVRIATDTGRSINTIYNHTRAILAKLEARRSTEAIAIARARGYIT